MPAPLVSDVLWSIIKQLLPSNRACRRASPTDQRSRCPAGILGLSDTPMSDRWLQHVVEAPGYVLGLPGGKAAYSAQFSVNVAGGHEDLGGLRLCG
jgi:hypothetical protein